MLNYYVELLIKSRLFYNSYNPGNETSFLLSITIATFIVFLPLVNLLEDGKWRRTNA